MVVLAGVRPAIDSRPVTGRRPSPGGAAPTAAGQPWLLLAHQLPARPVGPRVKIWRRLQYIGAVAVKNAVHALPNQPETREDFEWVRAEVVAAGGQAIVFEASTADGTSSETLQAAFRRDREHDYRAATRALDGLSRAAVSKRRGRDPRALDKAVRTWRERLTRLEAIDYFAAPGRDEARAALSRLEAVGARAPLPAPTAPSPLAVTAFRRRRWLTRPRPGIDRIASAWLIRRFVDPHATFAFGEGGAGHGPGTLTFDMFGGDFTHEGDACTFEVLRARFGLTDPRLRDLGELVHDLDLKDGKHRRADAPLLGALVEGLRRAHADDQVLLDQGMALFEALFRGHAAPPATPVPAPRASPPGGRRKKRGA